MVRFLRILFLAALAGLPAAGALAQETPSRPIQDNSFLIEEAYNQEEGVVQHIFTFHRQPSSGLWHATFTQEWPVSGVTHQLSYTLLAGSIGRAAGSGAGDAAVNYRWQAVGDGEARLALAPRLSVLLPTGDEKRRMGAGTVSVQVNVPASFAISNAFVAHGNAGWTYAPKARNERGERADTSFWNLGGSLVWIGGGRFNALVEALWTSSDVVTAPGRTQAEREMLVSPGIRWAHDLPGGIQIVPGIAVPISVGSTRSRSSVFVYLSIEHPFRRAAAAKRP